MKKETLYLDTSVPSAYYDERKPERQRITWEFWKKLGNYVVYISEMTEIKMLTILQWLRSMRLILL